eukprot:TRINITY_DN790_c0_g1_i3.p1 TRINITY_DN790_c0_g1~~TRINITY_DN790_c0_g1_i3.p1  ORF type:complete len:743 (+),score=201.42 TRINITY_DN790_c0_g1_i3:3-2231(+)
MGVNAELQFLYFIVTTTPPSPFQRRMQTFKVRVACDLYGSKHNAMFLFKPPPTEINEIIAEAERFYQGEAESRKPAGHPGPAFKIMALQVFNDNQWQDVTDIGNVTDGCQLYAFQQQSEWHNDAGGQGALPDPVSEAEVNQLQQQHQQHDQPVNVIQGDPVDVAFQLLDLKKDGVITLDEMLEAFRSLQLRFSPSQVQDLFIVADEDRDGVVNRSEFTRFALRFPTVVDSIHQRKVDEEVQAKEAEVLREAEAALHAVQEVERQLLEQAADASKRVRDLMGQIADHKINHESVLQRKPLVEAQQQQLVEQELALAAQKDKLRQAQDNIRKDIEDQLNAVTTSITSPRPQHQQQQQQQQQQQPPPQQQYQQYQQQQPLQQQMLQQLPGGTDHARGPGSIASSATSSFFLPSESPAAGPPLLPNESLPPTPAAKPKSAGPTMTIGTEIEACNFETKPEFNGLRGKVSAFTDDGRLSVDFYIRGGLTLDMLPGNVKPATPIPSGTPAIGSEVRANVTAKSSGLPQPVDLTGCAGRVVGYRGGVLLCEFPPKPGIFEIRVSDVVGANQQAQGHSIQDVSQVVQQQQQQQQQQPQTPKRLTAAAAQTPEIAAALARLGNIEPVSPYRSILPTSPLKMFPPPTLATAAPVYVDTAAPVAPLPTTETIWSGVQTRGISPSRRQASDSGSPLANGAYKPAGVGLTPSYTSLLPQSTQDLLNKVAAKPSAVLSPSNSKTPYALGPIDPASL